MDTGSFDYELPDDRIAQVPVEPRHSARLLVDEDPAGGPRHGRVSDLPRTVGPGDVVVVNTTRVLPARLRLHKATGAAVEVLLLEPAACAAGPHTWEALVRPGRRVPEGTVLEAGADLRLVVGGVLGGGRRLVELHTTDLHASLAVHGEVPLPPYLTRGLADPERYQTVFADAPGSVAAPTAGLHLTDAVLDAMRRAGADVVGVDLWVGLGTFRPISAERIEDHAMHEERYSVPARTWKAVMEAERVTAIGTTSLRALETVASTGRLRGRTDLYLRPGSPVRVVDRLLTNFHLPRSSLLVLVEAFAGPRWRALYAEALASGYRFLSFGDAMLVSRDPATPTAPPEPLR